MKPAAHLLLRSALKGEVVELDCIAWIRRLAHVDTKALAAYLQGDRFLPA